MGPFSWLELRTECRVPCLYQFQVRGRAPRRTGVMTKWNNFLPIGNSTFAPTEFRVFFPKWKAAPFSTRLAAMLQTKLQAIVVRFNLKVTVELIPVKSQ